MTFAAARAGRGAGDLALRRAGGPSRSVVLRDRHSFAFIRYLCTAAVVGFLGFSLVPHTATGVPAWALGVPFAAVFAVARARASRRGVFVMPDGLVVRNAVASTFITWGEIDRFDVGAFFGEWRTVIVRLRSGRAIHLQALATRNPDLFPRDTEPQGALQVLQTCLDAYRTGRLSSSG